jgi:hypothetical protein
MLRPVIETALVLAQVAANAALCFGQNMQSDTGDMLPLPAMEFCRWQAEQRFSIVAAEGESKCCSSGNLKLAGNTTRRDSHFRFCRCGMRYVDTSSMDERPRLPAILSRNGLQMM